MRLTKIVKAEIKTIEREEVVGHKCDVCGKEELSGEYMPDNWFCFSSGHQNWGNDSDDSIEGHEVCSANCFIRRSKKLLEDLEDDQDTAYIGAMSFEFTKDLCAKIEENKSLQAKKDDDMPEKIKPSSVKARRMKKNVLVTYIEIIINKIKAENNVL